MDIRIARMQNIAQRSDEAATRAAASQAPASVEPSNGVDAERSVPNDTAQVREVARQLEGWLQQSSRSLQFTVDESSGRVVITVQDAATRETIRQIPSEEVLRLARSLERSASSPAALVDQRV